jgi:hypothetical protein
MKDTRVKISFLIENQIPKYLRESSPLLVDFLRQYYISAETKGQPLDILENIDQYIKLDLLTRVRNNTQLTDIVSFFDDEIQVESTEGFPDSYGLIKINNEIILYESKTENIFLNCTRGFSGVESYGDASFEKNVIFTKSNASEHNVNDTVVNLSGLFLKEFLEKIKKQLLPGFENRELNSDLNQNLFIKQSKDFYSSKGTKNSFEILFRALYGERVTVIRPSEFLIEPSKSNYLITKDIVVEEIEGNIGDLINQTIFQNEDYYPSASSTVTRIERIFRNNKEYYILSLDFGYDRDILAEGSFIGDFNIHPKTKVIGNVEPNQKFIDVDSTAGFPNSGVLVVNRSGIEFNITYNSKSLNQFFECENVPTIEDGLDIRLDTYAYGFSPSTGERIKFRIGGVLSDLNISENTILSGEGDTIRIISPGKIITDTRSKNWLYNISITYNIKDITREGLVITYDNHNFVKDDTVIVESTTGLQSFEATVQEVLNNKQIVIVSDSSIIIDNEFTYRIKRNISKSKSDNYLEISDINSNVQNVYENLDDRSIYITSPSIPSYLIEDKTISDRTILVNGLQKNNEIQFSKNHYFITGDVIKYSYGNKGENLNIPEGLYFVRRVNNRKIRLYKSVEDIVQENTAISKGIINNRFITFTDKNILDNKITLFTLADKKLTTQKLVRKIDNPKFSKNLNETKFGSTGIFLNGVEISNYKSNDFVYYGPIEKVESQSNLSNYDIINPNIIKITDPNGVGVGASVILHVTGNLKKINISDPGFDYITIPTVNIFGGNGSGCKLDVNLINFTHNLIFNSENNNVVDLNNNTINFSEEHKFRDIEKIVYKSSKQNPIGGLSDLSNYYLKSISSTSIQLYQTERDALVGINTVNFLSLGKGTHAIESVLKKKRISTIKVLNGGNNYSNKKVTASRSNINVEKNTIYAKNHGYNDKDIIYYRSTNQRIGGVLEGNYYVKYINENEFSLIEIKDDIQDFNFINNIILEFSSAGTGTHIFNYPEITFSVEGITSVNKFSLESSRAKIQPIFRGKIDNVFVSNSGSRYGDSSIVNYERQPSFELVEGSGAILKSVILNDRIEKILVLNGGANYNTPPEIKISGSGNGAIATPIIENGKIINVVVVNKGRNYKENDTIVKAETDNLKFKTKLLFKIKSWNINEYFRLTQSNQISSEYQSILTEPLNELYGLQYKHIAVPKALREIIFTSKIIDDGDEYYITDIQNDIETNKDLLVHSPILGWAYDGNPIYGPYGFDTPNGGLVRRMRSGYSLLTENLRNRPNFTPGFFVEDYIFTDSGDLDIHNGRFCITPEFPNGIYAYFCTISDEDLIPQFPYIIGNFYKSEPIIFNFDKKSNQDVFDVNKNNLIRNSSPYNFLSENTNYEYIINPNKIINQNSRISSITTGSVDFIDIVSPGDNYRVGERIIIESSDNDAGFGASAEISKILGKKIQTLDTELNIINDVQFSNSDIFNNTIGITSVPHNLNAGDSISIRKFGIDDIFLDEKFYRINVVPTKFTLNEDVLDNETISYFSVDGNLNYPFIIEDDIFTIGEEEIKVLSIERNNGRIKVLRSSPGINYFKNEILVENPRKFYFNKILDKNYKINEKYYFNPSETIGIGTTSGVGIGITLSISNPGIGITQVFVPTKSLYLKNHNLKTGDKLVYDTNGGSGIAVSNDGLTSFTLNDNDILYVARINDDFIGISKNKVILSNQGEFVGIGTNTSTLYFIDFGTGNNHSFFTQYDENLTRTINNIKTKLNINVSSSLMLNDVIDLDVKSLQTKVFNIFYDLDRKNILVNKLSIESIDNDILTISNHNLIKGQKVLFNLDGKKYYALPLNSDEIKLSRTYFGSINNDDILNIPNSEGDLFLSLVNPPIEVFTESTIIFDLSDESLTGFDFNLYEDNNYRNIFYGFDGFDVSKNGNPGNSQSNLILKVKESKRTEIYYTLSIPDKDKISAGKLEYFNDDINILKNNTLLIKPSEYNGEKVISGIGTNYIEFNLNKIPESLNYNNDVDSIINYTTKSKNSIGPISEIKIISKGKKYKKLPIVKEISTEFGNDAFLKIGTNSIGKIKNIVIEDIGFDYFSDNTLRPFSKIPEVLKVQPLSSLEEIRVISFGENYNIAPDLVLIDGITNKVVSDVILDFKLNRPIVDIIKNTNGINDVTPKLIPINNSSGINILFVEFISQNKTLKVTLNQDYSNISDFPFAIGDSVLIENTKVLNNTGRSFNSSNYDYKLFEVVEIDPRIGGNNPIITLDVSEISFSSSFFGIYDENSSFGIVTPQKYFPKFKISLKKNVFSVGETVISGNNSGIVEFWDAKNELLKVNTIDNFNTNEIITGKTSGYTGVISDIFKYESFYNISSSSVVIRSWQDSVGFLNEDLQRIHNNEYYQYFSYSLKSIVQYNDWESSVSSLNHTSGFKKFSDLDIEIKNPTYTSDEDTEKLYVGIETNQNKGNFTSLSSIDSFAKINCRYDYDLVSENSDLIDSKLISDQIYFESRELFDYFDCIGNRVLSIDDISDQFKNRERLNTVITFNL